MKAPKNYRGGDLFVKRFSVKEDNEIVDLYLNRNENAILETENKYKSFIFSICNGILRQKQDSEECVNTVYQKLWESIPPEQPDDLKAFIARIARTTAIDFFRSNNRLKRSAGVIDSLDDFADFLADDYSIEEEIYANDLAIFLNDFLRSLSETERICFVKRYYFNCSYREIEKQTHIPKSTIYLTLEKVKKKLKEELSKEGYLS